MKELILSPEFANKMIEAKQAFEQINTFVYTHVSNILNAGPHAINWYLLHAGGAAIGGFVGYKTGKVTGEFIGWFSSMYERAFFRQSLTDHDYQGRPIKTVEQSVINGAKTGKVVGAIAGTLLGTLII